MTCFNNFMIYCLMIEICPKSQLNLIKIFYNSVFPERDEPNSYLNANVTHFPLAFSNCELFEQEHIFN